MKRKVPGVVAAALFGLGLGGCASSDIGYQSVTNPPGDAIASWAAPSAMPASPSVSVQSTPMSVAMPASTPPAYYGPNAVGTGTPVAPSPAMPLVDSAASCGSILDSQAHQLCLERAGQR